MERREFFTVTGKAIAALSLSQILPNFGLAREIPVKWKKKNKKVYLEVFVKSGATWEIISFLCTGDAKRWPELTKVNGKGLYANAHVLIPWNFLRKELQEALSDNQFIIDRVKRGDTFLEILDYYLEDLEDEKTHVIAALNNLNDGQLTIYPGQELWIPSSYVKGELIKKKKKGFWDRKREAREKQVEKKKDTKKKRYLKFPSGLKLEIVSTKDSEGLDGRGEEFYDSNKSGNLLLRIYSEDINKRVSNNFYLREFIRDSGYGLEKYRITLNGEHYFKYARIDLRLIKKLEKARVRLNKQIKISSGYRSYGYNIRTYKASGSKPKTKSRHISGQAVDIINTTRDDRKVLRKIFKKGGIGEGWTTIHVDVRRGVARWTYGGYRP